MATNDWHEAVQYPSVIDEQFASWYSGLALSVVASALSYYCTALYSDLLRVFRLQVRETRCEPANLAESAAVAPDVEAAAGAAAGGNALMRSTATHVTALKTLSVVKFAVLFVTFVVMDFVSLAILPLTLVVPTAMLVFLWGGIYRWRAGALTRRGDRVVLGVILALVAVGVWAAPKGLYIVHVKRVVVWDARSILYTAAFLGTAVLLHLARLFASRRARLIAALGAEAGGTASASAHSAAGGSARESDRRRRAQARGWRDATTVLSALLTGILGGQALVLLKLVAEICENAILHSDFVFAGTAVFLVVSFSLATSALHLSAFHATLARLDEANVQLLVPVHRLALIASASVGAAVYLQEWAVPEGSLRRALVYYGVSICGLLAVCALLASQALRCNPLEPFRTHAAASRAAQQTSGQEATEQRATEQPPPPPPPAGGVRMRVRVSSSLWALGNRDEGFDAEDSDSDDSGLFFMSRSRSHLGSHQDESPLARKAGPPKAPQLPAAQQVTLPQSSASGDGYDSDDSFHSVMDAADAVAADVSGPGVGEAGVPGAGVLARHAAGALGGDAAEQQALDFRYPVPRDTMVFPRAMGTSKSYWADAGLSPGGWRVRGPTYDADRVKVPCGEARMAILALEWIYAPDVPFKHMSARKGGFMERHHLGRGDRPFLLVINFVIPSVGHYVTYLARRPDVPDAEFDHMLRRFVDAEDDAYRNARLKLIPGVLEGSFLVRKAVGAKPALLCQKLTTTYHRGENHLEVTIDVGSSLIGSKIFAAVKGFASGLTLHLGVVIESKTRRELPERLLCGVDIYTPVMHPSQAPVVELPAEAPPSVDGSLVAPEHSSPEEAQEQASAAQQAQQLSNS